MSLNVGGPREVPWHGNIVKTSIWKYPVEGRIAVSKLNLVGDQQSDLSVHGGTDKAVYAYPCEHYDYWRKVLPKTVLSWGNFGENFTTEGLLEQDVRVGDRLRVGSAEFVVTQPRMPCFKLGIRFGRMEMVKEFLKSKRTGFYFSVFSEGEVATGDTIEWAERQVSGLTIADIVDLYAADSDNQDLLRRASQTAALPEAWRQYFRKRLWDADV